jgi:hypothetical protein
MASCRDRQNDRKGLFLCHGIALRGRSTPIKTRSSHRHEQDHSRRLLRGATRERANVPVVKSGVQERGEKDE